MVDISFGALVPLLKEQLDGYGLDEKDLDHFQQDADAITRLAIRGIIPDSVKRAARQRLANNIAKAINKLEAPHD